MFLQTNLRFKSENPAVPSFDLFQNSSLQENNIGFASIDQDNNEISPTEVIEEDADVMMYTNNSCVNFVCSENSIFDQSQFEKSVNINSFKDNNMCAPRTSSQLVRSVHYKSKLEDCIEHPIEGTNLYNQLKQKRLLSANPIEPRCSSNKYYALKPKLKRLELSNLFSRIISNGKCLIFPRESNYIRNIKRLKSK